LYRAKDLAQGLDSLSIQIQSVMKKYVFSFAGLILCGFTFEALASVAQTTGATTPIRGELLKFRIHYGVIDAGEAEIEVKDENKLLNERNTLHLVGTGRSKGAFDWFFKVRDRYESFIDEQALVPIVFIRKVDEGGYKFSQNQVYSGKKVSNNGKSYDVPNYTQDMLSAFYFARTMDLSNAKEGDVFSVQSFIDNEVWDLKIKYVGKETITTDIGKIRCLKFRPIVQKGRIFKKEEDLNVWISDDKNHIPVRAQANVLVGSVKMDITSYSNLLNPLAVE
jgi:hypothetical protein